MTWAAIAQLSAFLITPVSPMRLLSYAVLWFRIRGFHLLDGFIDQMDNHLISHDKIDV